MRKWTIPSALLLLSLLFLFADQGQKFQANAEANFEELVDPPNVEDKIGVVPHGLSTDSDVAKREVERSLRSNAEHCMGRHLCLVANIALLQLCFQRHDKRPYSPCAVQATSPKAPKYPFAGFDLTIEDH